MKIFIRIIGSLLALGLLTTASNSIPEDPYFSSNIAKEVKNISLNKLLDFKKIAVAIEDKFDKAKFHYIIAYEIDHRKKELDEKFRRKKEKYQTNTP